MSAHPPGHPQWHGPDPSAPLTPAWPRDEPAANLFSAARLAAVKPPRRHSAGLVVVLVFSSLLLIGVGVWLGLVLGTETLFVVGLLALFPLGVCLAALRWIDRWDPEPRLALLFAFAWGAGASIAGSLIFGEAFGKAFAAVAAATGPDLFGAVVQAPVVEETMKGLGVLLVFLVARSHFDGPVDGIVYGGMIAAGFAFTENILYFSDAYAQAGTAMVQVFVLRGLFSPFAHVMFTAWTGFALGLAAQRGARRLWPVYFLLGLVPAMIGHFLWNGGMGLIFQDFWTFYLLLQMPLFACAVVVVVLLRAAERRLIRRRLGDYAEAGWFTAEEVDMFATRNGRRQAAGWAAVMGHRTAMRGFTRTAMRLAATRNRIVSGSNRERALRDEARLLALILQYRTILTGRPETPGVI
ncbi:PrsW family intramembrane metalloprotease [Arthrobacter sp. JSM 101049]|uniref:PrsW family intramembrane metalloprotease n=1 Tax=Arthrobacter sp. JSM 101049 TaxID=929097 RepID=UPI0035671030